MLLLGARNGLALGQISVLKLTSMGCACFIHDRRKYLTFGSPRGQYKKAFELFSL